MKTALITGISKGIGKALAEKFLSEGFTVIGTSRDTITYTDDHLKILELELTDSTSIEKCAESVASIGTIDILINNAGVLIDEDDIAINIDKLRDTLEINLIGTIDLTERIIPMIAKGGHILNISSQAGSLTDMENFHHTHSPLHYPAYKISKTALNMYTRTLALRLVNENRGITVSAVHPGWVRTDMGGDEAPISPAEAAADIYRLSISNPETGEFWYKGKKFPW